MKKALSPLMATVMLIALTLTVAALLGSWFTTMTKTQTSTIEESAKTQINCTSAILDIVDVTCSASEEKLKVVIHNLGDIELYDFSTYALINNTGYTNSTGGPNSTNLLNPGEQYILTYFCSNATYCIANTSVSKIRVSPGNCPQAWMEKSVSISCS